MRRIAGCVVLVAALAIGATSSAVAQVACPDIDLDQQWLPGEREAFWFTSQGSRLVPYAWFTALEEIASLALFKDGLDGFGFIPAPSSTWNPGGLPIGFVADPGAPALFVGLTCAACHTGRLTFMGRPLVVEGGATLADFVGFMKNLESTIRENAKIDDKFMRFVSRVLMPNPDSESVKQLRAAMHATAEALAMRWNAYWPTEPPGRGRIDAFGQIYNQVVAFDINAKTNARVADAPVSYPFLWNTPQHDVVQWNGVASNGIFGLLGPLFRNVGEASGVFGEVTVVKTERLPKYQSSIRLSNLRRLENMVKRLRPPAWPRNCAPIDAVLERRGRQVYKETCKRCHQVIARTNLNKRFKVKMVSLEKVGTDTTMARRYASKFIDDQVKTGTLEGARKAFVPWDLFGSHATGGELLTNVILGTVLGRGASDPMLTGQDPDDATAIESNQKKVDADLQKVRKRAEKDKLKYKARPLNGVWATAPYLHNGSVASLAELLKPVGARRTSFWVGNTEFDVQNVGMSIAQVQGATEFQVGPTNGNSNAGHSFGVDLSEEDKRALLEYLKVVGE